MIGFFIINSKLIPLDKLKRLLFIALLVSYCLPQGGDMPDVVTINPLNYYSTHYSTNMTTYGHAGITKGNLNNITNINPALLKNANGFTAGFSLFSEELDYFYKVNNPLLESWSILIPGDLSISIGSNMKYNRTVEYRMEVTNEWYPDGTGEVFSTKDQFKIQTYSVNFSKELDKNITIGFKYNRDKLFKKASEYIHSYEVKDHVDYWGVGLLYNKNFGNIGMMYLNGKNLYRTINLPYTFNIPEGDTVNDTILNYALYTYYHVPSILGIGVSCFNNPISYLINVKKIFWDPIGGFHIDSEGYVSNSSHPYEENILTAGVQCYITDSFELSLTTTLNDYNFDNDFNERKIITIGGIYKSQDYDIDLTYGSTYDAEEEDFLEYQMRLIILGLD
jgi:hypothetical protein